MKLEMAVQLLIFAMFISRKSIT